jgi:predicted transcriptional regulator
VTAVQGVKRFLFYTLSGTLMWRARSTKMAQTVKLSDDLVETAKRIAAVEHRSVPRQIEFYFRMAQIAEENPDLSFSLIREIMKADSEEATEEYTFG